MTIDKAIRELETFRQINIRSLKPTLKTALTLGIKALERYRNLRDAGKDVGMPLLMGETKK